MLPAGFVATKYRRAPGGAHELKQAFGSGDPQTKPAAVRTREPRVPGPWGGAPSREVTSCPVRLGLHHAPTSSTGTLARVLFRRDVANDEFGKLKNLPPLGHKVATPAPLARTGLPRRRVGRSCHALVSSASLYINCKMDYGAASGCGPFATKERFGKFRGHKSADCEGLT